MKIKCPGCAAVLSIPETAAGTVVQCKCGKKLRAPGGSAAGGPTGGSPAAGGQAANPPQSKRPTTANPQNPASRPPSARPQAPTARPQPQASADNFGGLDAGLFDELSEKDLQGVAAVYRPGSAVAAAPSAGGKLMQQYGPTASGSGQNASSSSGARPGLLTLMGVINGLWSVVVLLGILAIFGLFAFFSGLNEGELDAAEVGGLMVVFVVASGVMLALTVATCVSCFTGKPACWYIVLFSYAYGFATRITGTISLFQEEPPVSKLIGAGVGLLVGLAFWIYLHQKEPRAFYGTRSAGLAGVIAVDVLGFLVGFGLNGFPLFT